MENLGLCVARSFGEPAYAARLAGLLVGILGAVLVRAARQGAAVQTAA